MSRKDSLMKQIDEIAERVRFWHNIIFAILTGVAGILFGMTQNKILLNKSVWFLGIIAIGILIFAISRLSKLNNERNKYIKELEKEM